MLNCCKIRYVYIELMNRNENSLFLSYEAIQRADVDFGIVDHERRARDRPNGYLRCGPSFLALRNHVAHERKVPSTSYNVILLSVPPLVLVCVDCFCV